MDSLGINLGFLEIQLLVCGVWPLLSLAALIGLRRSNQTGITKVLWTALILAVPILGVLAFFIVRPNGDNNS
ncbi:MAG: hypothetical protein HND47_12435 [Chloroflexi bacterium]|nr:hypothetical protein [Chloroflexota bacterium]